jgi:hypothetical protein
MLFREAFLRGIREGRITLAFRRWRRPTVRAGGTLLTAAGQLTIVSVARVDPARISEADARRAGYATRDDLLAGLDVHAGGTVYRIELGALRPDPRVALRASASLSADEQGDVLRRLARLDRASPGGPWALRTLELIHTHPGLRAADLCRLAGQDKERFKLNVRKLKGLGLTESLGTGYRLSPRGQAVRLAARAAARR